MNATYKLNELRMPLYLFIVEDGNGEMVRVKLWQCGYWSQKMLPLFVVWLKYLKSIIDHAEDIDNNVR